jgi:hypothetical protein
MTKAADLLSDDAITYGELVCVKGRREIITAAKIDDGHRNQGQGRTASPLCGRAVMIPGLAPAASAVALRAQWKRARTDLLPAGGWPTPGKLSRRARIDAVIRLLCDSFPQTFSRRGQHPQPLKVGVYADALAGDPTA